MLFTTLPTDVNVPITRPVYGINGDVLTVTFRTLTASQCAYTLKKIEPASNDFVESTKVQIEILSNTLISITQENNSDTIPELKTKPKVFCGKKIDAIDEAWIDENIPYELIILLTNLVITENSFSNAKKKYSRERFSFPNMSENSTAQNAEEISSTH